MLRNMKKKKKKKTFQLEKKFNFFSSYSNFVFAFYTLISPNLQINSKKKLHTLVDLKEAPKS